MAGRPRKPIKLSGEQIEQLASIGCTDEEIANLADVSELTLRRYFQPQLKKGRSMLRVRLRRQQIKMALDDNNVTMAIWLGKQYLGQRDRHEVSGDEERPIRIAPYNANAAIAAIAPGSATDRSSDGDG